MSCSRESKALLKEWTARLGLIDWRIALWDNCRPETMAEPDCDGYVNYVENEKQAEIELVDPQYRASDATFLFEYERTLIHELLHLKFALIDCDDENSLQHRLVHVLIDDLARALVDAKRAG